MLARIIHEDFYCNRRYAAATSLTAGGLARDLSEDFERFYAGCSKSPSSKAAASEEARRTLWYVEPLSDARTPLAGFFSILLKINPELSISPVLIGVGT